MANRPAVAAASERTEASQPPRPGFSVTTILSYAALGLGVFLAGFPFMWMVSTSLMTLGEVAVGRTIPDGLREGDVGVVAQQGLDNYRNALSVGGFFDLSYTGDPRQSSIVRYSAGVQPIAEYTDVAWTRRLPTGIQLSGYMWNSLRIATIQIIGTLLTCIPAAYAFARMRFFGRNVLFTLMLSTLMIPEIFVLVPNYLTVIWLGRLSESLCGSDVCGWVNNWPALTFPFMATAFNIFLLRQFFAQIPDDLWEAARIDGAGHFRFLWQVVVPLSKAPIMTVITFAFIGSWNSLMWPLMVTNNDAWRPVAVGLEKFVSSDRPGDFHLQMAASVAMVVPVLILYFFTQKQFTEGIAASGLKG